MLPGGLCCSQSPRSLGGWTGGGCVEGKLEGIFPLNWGERGQAKVRPRRQNLTLCPCPTKAVLRGRGWNEDEEAGTRSAGPWEVAGVCPHQGMSCRRRTDRGTCPKPHGGRNRLPGRSKRQTNTRSPGWRRRESRDEVAPGSPTSHRVVCSCRFEAVAPTPWEVPPWSGGGHFPWCGSCSSWTEVDGMGSRNTEKRDGGLGEQDSSGSSPLDEKSNISPPRT
ncbi:uncharacterized protein LOC127474050 isoform X1 [Manacus candei]|uniref:uncharacterized protein LOC127474050 isoform X1 n=1 Tax=Manacus candei TaxID=415023 RepID=UPI002225C065|nr:uncharacterized protein LOC127474050 isoform X1 [Manacus candei]